MAHPTIARGGYCIIGSLGLRFEGLAGIEEAEGQIFSQEIDVPRINARIRDKRCGLLPFRLGF
jgi:hypothetical protein